MANRTRIRTRTRCAPIRSSGEVGIGYAPPASFDPNLLSGPATITKVSATKWTVVGGGEDPLRISDFESLSDFLVRVDATGSPGDVSLQAQTADEFQPTAYSSPYGFTFITTTELGFEAEKVDGVDYIEGAEPGLHPIVWLHKRGDTLEARFGGASWEEASELFLQNEGMDLATNIWIFADGNAELEIEFFPLEEPPEGGGEELPEWVPTGALFAFRGDKAEEEGVWVNGTGLTPWTEAIDVSASPIVILGSALCIPEASEETSGMMFYLQPLLDVLTAAAAAGGYTIVIRCTITDSASYFGLTVQDDDNTFEMSAAGGGGMFITSANDAVGGTPAMVMDTEPVWPKAMQFGGTVGGVSDVAIKVTGEGAVSFGPESGVSAAPIAGLGANLVGSISINAKMPTVGISGIWVFPASPAPYTDLDNYTSEEFLFPD